MPTGKYAYAKGDYGRMNQKLSKTDWRGILGDRNTQEAWDLFTMEIDKAKKEYVPWIRGNAPCNTRKPVWMDDKTLKKV
jgi:hypothetical protein